MPQSKLSSCWRWRCWRLCSNQHSYLELHILPSSVLTVMTLGKYLKAHLYFWLDPCTGGIVWRRAFVIYCYIFIFAIWLYVMHWTDIFVCITEILYQWHFPQWGWTSISNDWRWRYCQSVVDGNGAMDQVCSGLWCSVPDAWTSILWAQSSHSVRPASVFKCCQWLVELLQFYAVIELLYGR